jgi:hypothetical protein
LLPIAERHVRSKADRFDRPLRLRDGRVFLNHFPALRTGLLSLSPFLLRPAVVRIEKVTSRLWRTSRDKSSAYNPKPLKLTRIGRRRILNSLSARPLHSNSDKLPGWRVNCWITADLPIIDFSVQIDSV